MTDTERQATIARLERAGLLPYDGGALDPAALEKLSDDEMDLLAFLVLAREVAEAEREGRQ